MAFLSDSAGRRRRKHAPQWDAVTARALDALPAGTRWAVACCAEFRAEGSMGLRGILHHDGAFLRFTTWGGVERFVGVPVEFSWTGDEPGAFLIDHQGAFARFDTLEPLASIVPDAPSFFVANDEALSMQLSKWLRTWAPDGPRPLASPM